MKYIILTDETKAKTPFFVVGMVSHLQLANMLRFAMPGCRVVSAGFVEFKTDTEGKLSARTFGRSESLALGPTEDDAQLIECLVGATLQAARHFEALPSKALSAAMPR